MSPTSLGVSYAYCSVGKHGYSSVCITTVPDNSSEAEIMSDRLVNIDNLCKNPKNHSMHICELTKAG
jgi:hypothetical protein